MTNLPAQYHNVNVGKDNQRHLSGTNYNESERIRFCFFVFFLSFFFAKQTPETDFRAAASLDYENILSVTGRNLAVLNVDLVPL